MRGIGMSKSFYYTLTAFSGLLLCLSFSCLCLLGAAAVLAVGSPIFASESTQEKTPNIFAALLRIIDLRYAGTAAPVEHISEGDYRKERVGAYEQLYEHPQADYYELTWKEVFERMFEITKLSNEVFAQKYGIALDRVRRLRVATSEFELTSLEKLRTIDALGDVDRAFLELRWHPGYKKFQSRAFPKRQAPTSSGPSGPISRTQALVASLKAKGLNISVIAELTEVPIMALNHAMADRPSEWVEARLQLLNEQSREAVQEKLIGGLSVRERLTELLQWSDIRNLDDLAYRLGTDTETLSSLMNSSAIASSELKASLLELEAFKANLSGCGLFLGEI